MKYKNSVYHDLKNIDRETARRIMDEIGSVLSGNPKAGKALSGNFKGLYSYRIGDYRVIYKIIGDCVLVLRVGDRGKVYR